MYGSAQIDVQSDLRPLPVEDREALRIQCARYRELRLVVCEVEKLAVYDSPIADFLRDLEHWRSRSGPSANSWRLFKRGKLVSVCAV